MLHWVRSFLSGQVQVVHFAGQHSKESPLLCGLPQGSVSGPILFSFYTADVVRIAQSFGVCIHCYADDLQLYVYCHVGDAEVAAARLLACISAIDKWIRSNRLKMNPDKIQFIWLGSRQQLAHLNITPLHLHDGTIVVPSTDVRSLGFVFDSQLSMTDHVNHVTCACFYQLRQLCFIRDSLMDDAAKMLVHTFVSSRVDYCNSLLFGAPTHVLRKLQSVLNASARLITGGRRCDHIKPVLRDLHWLPVT